MFLRWVLHIHNTTKPILQSNEVEILTGVLKRLTFKSWNVKLRWFISWMAWYVLYRLGKLLYLENDTSDHRKSIPKNLYTQPPTPSRNLGKKPPQKVIKIHVDTLWSNVSKVTIALWNTLWGSRDTKKAKCVCFAWQTFWGRCWHSCKNV